MWIEQLTLIRVKCIHDGEYYEGQDGRGEWRTKAVSVSQEIECDSTEDVADVGQIHPRVNREGLAFFPHTLHTSGAVEISAPGTVPAILSKFLPNESLKRARGRFHPHGLSIRVPQ